MKTLLLFVSLMVAILLQSCATAKPIQTVTIDNPIVYVDSLTGTKDELFVKANEWMIAIFKDSKSIIQFSDKTEGVLIGKYLLLYAQFPVLNTYLEVVTTNQYVKYIDEYTYAIIDIRVKDNKARISIKPDTWHYQSNLDRTKENVIPKINALCVDFLRYLKTESIKF